MKKRRSIRLKNYDYSQKGAYFVTICTHGRKCLFGDFVNGKMELNKTGNIVESEWDNTPSLRPNVELHDFIVMPNHFHGILTITKCTGVLNTPCELNSSDELNSPINNNGAYGNGAYGNTPLRGLRSPSQTVGAIIRGFKAAVTKQINIERANGNMPQQPVWQRNFYEHIIRDENDLNRIREYIINNPAKWEQDKYYKS